MQFYILSSNLNAQKHRIKRTCFLSFSPK
uniref:Uncharacterized protein n=1 Tax=Anguilla anguilla TaxID=7936 RepID=A0A0E9T034_ANGAN